MSMEPERVGRYRLLRALGRGSQATVFEAEAGPGGERVALKRLHPRALLLRPEASVRLRREVDLLRGLSHPGVVRLLDAGEADGVPFLVYELVPGATRLDEACAGRPLRERTRLVLEAAQALGAVHERGVVHRDLSPSNVLVDRTGRVRLVDFGFARGPDDALLTRTGAALGTPGWLAPEVGLEGSRAAAGPAADVWSLGALLYLALTGEPPFGDGGLVEALQQLERAGPPSPRARVPEVPPGLDAVCRRALARGPEERFPDAGAFARALEAALVASSGGTPLTPPTSLDAPPPAGKGPPDGSGRRASGRRAVAVDPLPGERWGRWTILRPLGEGGMGRVLLAHDEALGREVALKLLPSGANERQRRRFLREAEAARRVAHPGLAAVHDVGELEGRLFLVMEAAAGEGLERVLLRGALAPRVAARMAADVARALEALHRGGVLHRDVKPANVIVAPDGRARLIDLGVALLEDSERLTRTHMTVGTPLYMAPEQLSGEEVDQRADVWSLGAVLYEALTGSPPGGPTTSPAELALLRAKLPPRPGSLRAGIDPALDAICLRALAVDPRRRWAAAGELADALEGWLEAPPRRRPPPGRRALGLVALLALAVLGAAAWLASRAGATARAQALGRELEARAAGAARLADLSPDPALVEALARADREDAQVRAARLWLGLVGLARGDRAGAARELELAGPAGVAPGGVAAALRGGLLALEGRDPDRALYELARAERDGLGVAELLGWRVRALADRGPGSEAGARAGLDLAAQARARRAGEPGDQDRLEAACHLVLGDRAAAEVALARVAQPPPALAWEVGLLAGQEALADRRLITAREALRGLERPPGPPSAREAALHERLLEVARAFLSQARQRPLHERGLVSELVALFELLGAVTPPDAAPPEDLRQAARDLLQGSILTGLPQGASVAAAAAETWPGDLSLLSLAVSCAEAAGAPSPVYSRLAAVAGRAAGAGPDEARLSARALLALTLARAGRGPEAAREAEGLLAELERVEAGGTVSPALVHEPRAMALLAAAMAARAAHRTDAALALLARAASVPSLAGGGVARERLLALRDAGRGEEAAREAAGLVSQPDRLGPRLQATAELVWRLLARPGQEGARLRLAQELIARREDPLGLWSLRLALLRARAGDGPGAARALEAARETRLGQALGIKQLLDGLRAGEPAVTEALAAAEEAATGAVKVE